MSSLAQSLAQVLSRHTREGELYEKLPNGRIRCVACGHRCLIPPGREGVCRVRFNEDGALKVPWGTEVVVDEKEHDRFEWVSFAEARRRCQPAELEASFLAGCGNSGFG